MGSALDAQPASATANSDVQQAAEKARVLDSVLKNMPESRSSLITGRRRCKAMFLNNQQPISVGV
jgi:hypothetical protein